MPEATKNLEKQVSLIGRIKLWLTGIGSYYLLTWVYDYVVVSFILIYFGFLKGIVIVVILSMAIDLATLKFYDWLKKDWLALETLKEMEHKKHFFGRLLNFVHNKSVFVTVVVLSLTSNAFVVTTYMRKGANLYNGLTKRDWAIFVSSSLLINVYWVFIIGGGIEIIKRLFKLFV